MMIDNKSQYFLQFQPDYILNYRANEDLCFSSNFGIFLHKTKPNGKLSILAPTDGLL